MPSYFMNIRTSAGELIPDLEGDDLGDVQVARAEALAVAGDLIAKAGGLDWTGCLIEVTDCGGETVFTLPFSDAAQLRRV